ncbi:Mername-AA168 protein (M67 family) [Schistosoma mansoni]|uniref:Mername-AA168 protein (M67 family) n=1 Tax=Schistosoma mansoni TaxID=6183 RepID=UPI00022DC524|nr:Mername-AA168 protein (M67 family) [Schistosoma mansoni]|eukprot:XP_018648702.1 Mername-AA168 protein (M67 family) [Schistosoma mansoni]
MPGGFIPGLPPIYPNSWISSGISNISRLEPADSNCTYGIHWIWVSMGLCVMDVQGGIALFCGILCLFLWIAVGIPQIVENFRTGIADKALSPIFLCFWTFGDVCNLIGCFLTHQLIMQIVVTGYCIVSDFVLVFQFIYYKLRHKAILRRMAAALKDGEISSSSSSSSPVICDESEQHNSDQGYQRLSVGLVGVGCLTLMGISLNSIEDPFNTYVVKQSISSGLHYQSRQLLEWKQYESTDHPFINSDPLNWKRKSTEGLSIFMFSMAVTGNISYGIQILLTSTEKNYLIRATPWLVGSFGVVLLDFFAVLDDHSACEVWRSRDRLYSSLVAIFPAALIGKPVTVILLDETRITGRLCSCDGLMNLQLDSGVIIRKPDSDRLNAVIVVETIMIFGKRIRYVTVPKSIDISSTLAEWESKSQDGRIFLPRPTKSSKPLRENQIKSNENELCQSSMTSDNFVDIDYVDNTENIPWLEQSDLEQFASIGVKPTGDKKVDLVMVQTLKVLNNPL